MLPLYLSKEVVTCSDGTQKNSNFNVCQGSLIIQSILEF